MPGSHHHLIPAALSILTALGHSRDVRATQGGAAAQAAAPQDVPEARRLSSEAKRASDAGDFARALELEQRAYELSGNRRLLFNVGKLHDKLGDCKPALRAFESYLRDVPNGTYRKSAQERVKALHASCGSAADSAANPQPARPGAAPPEAIVLQPQHPPVAPEGTKFEPVVVDREPSSYWTLQRSLGVGVLGGAALAAGAAIYYGLSAKQRDDDLDRVTREARALPPQDRPSWDATNRARAEERDTARTRAIVFSVVSGVLTGTGVTLLLTSTDRPKASVALQVVPSGAIVAYTSSGF